MVRRRRRRPAAVAEQVEKGGKVDAAPGGGSGGGLRVGGDELPLRGLLWRSEQLEQLTRYLMTKRVTPELINDITEYHEFHSKSFQKAAQLAENLPERMHVRLMMQLYKGLIRKSPKMLGFSNSFAVEFNRVVVLLFDEFRREF